MPEPRYRRRKEDRPDEIAQAAFEAFAARGYAATKVEDVAKRAGVSKGLLYLYYKTKEDLFKAVIRNVVVRRIDRLIAGLDDTDQSAEAFIRGPMLGMLRQMPGSPIAVVIRLLIAEGPKHPDLVDYYWDNVASRGLEAFQGLLDRAVESGEFRRCPASEQPQLFIAPVIMSVIWRAVFAKRSLDSDRLIETQIDLLLSELRADHTIEESP